MVQHRPNAYSTKDTLFQDSSVIFQLLQVSSEYLKVNVLHIRKTVKNARHFELVIWFCLVVFSFLVEVLIVFRLCFGRCLCVAHVCHFPLQHASNVFL